MPDPLTPIEEKKHELRVLLILIAADPHLAIEYAGRIERHNDLVPLIAHYDPQAAGDLHHDPMVLDLIEETRQWLVQPPST